MTHIDPRDTELNARLEKSVLDCIKLNFDNLTGADLRRAVFNADTAIRDTALRLSRCSTEPCIIAAQQVLAAARNVLAKAIAEGLGDNDLFKRDVQRNMPNAIEVLEAELAKHVTTCGTCGGEGNCPDCMVWDAPLTEVLATTPRDTDAYEAVEADILAAYPAIEACPRCGGTGEIETEALGFTIDCPTCSKSPDYETDAETCPTCGGDGDCMECDTLSVDDAKSYLDAFRAELVNPQSKNRNHILFVQGRIDEFEAYITRKSPAPTDPAPKATAQDDDIVTRLDAADVFHEPTGALIRDAADEIRRLRAENKRLETALNPSYPITVKFDVAKQGWVWFSEWHGLEIKSGDAFLSPDYAHENAVAYIKGIKGGVA